MALGIGATTAIFTVVNGVLLKPLPYPEPNRLITIWEKQVSDATLGTVAPANFYDWREQSHSFERMAAIDPYPDFILNGSGEARRLAGAAVSRNFFSLFGVRMALGRDFLPQEDRPGFSHVVILSYSAWEHYFGGSREVVGRSPTLNDASYTVIGVLPKGFSFVSKASDLQSRNRFDVWTPLALPSPPEEWQRGTHPLSVFARLKQGVSLQQAQVELDHIALHLQQLYPHFNKERGIAAVPLVKHVVADVHAALYMLLAAVGLLLALACANVANLQLARAATRRREIALRAALGASRERIARQLATESLVLALVGGLVGIALVFLSVPAIVNHLPADLPRASEIAVDWRVLIFASLLSISTGFVFGLAPIFQAREVNAGDSLKQAGRNIAPGRSRLQSTLIAGQIAISMVLLAVAVMMGKSLWKLLQVSPGFQTEHILTARLSLPPQYLNGYAYGTGNHPRISRFQTELLARVQQIPGVQSAAFTAYLPLTGVDNWWAFEIEGRPPKPPGVFDLANYRPVSPRYFETMNIPVLRGRGFSGNDTANSPLVAAINATMARKWWGTQNPIGQRVRIDDRHWLAVVGIVGDVHHASLAAKPEPELYIPYGQAPNVEARPIVVLRVSIAAGSAIRSLRKAISEVDANVPIDQIGTMEQLVYDSVGQSRFRAAVLVAFAFLSLLVASIGLYGVMSYSVNQRTREFGIRMAIGASRGAVLRDVLREAARLAAIGIGIGLLGNVFAERLIAGLLFGVRPIDPVVLSCVSLLLASVALLASYIPARRATKAEPTESLRYE